MDSTPPSSERMKTRGIKRGWVALRRMLIGRG